MPTANDWGTSLHCPGTSLYCTGAVRVTVRPNCRNDLSYYFD